MDIFQKRFTQYILNEDLQEALMGIVYPFTEDSENNERVESDENLVESLRKLIMGKFENESDEFYKWSRSIHHEVVKIFTHELCIDYLRP